MSVLKSLAQLMLRLEPYFLLLIVFLFWLTPEHLEFLLLFVPPLLARLILYRRLWTPTLLDPLLLLLPVLILLNYRYAPYARTLWIGSRGIMGALLVLLLVDLIRRRGSADRAAFGLVLLGLLAGVLALTTSMWSTKSALLDPIINLLPRLTNVPGVQGGFNVNEIAGGIAWLMPLSAAVAIAAWRNRQPANANLRFYATLAFGLMWLALFLGQSRMAIFGMIATMPVLIFSLIPPGWWRRLALLTLVAFTVLEVFLFIGVFSPDEALESRDEASLTSRLYIWDSAIQMIRDYPLTGVGMNKYRLDPVRDRYPVEGYEDKILPHAHNELLQIGADLGVPGMLLFIGWHLVALVLTVRIWRRGDDQARALAVGLLGGLIAHGVFGLADAITLWDRLSFIGWLTLGVLAGHYVVIVRGGDRSRQPVDG